MTSNYKYICGVKIFFMSETNRIEYKRELSDGLEKEVVAFLNYREGGIIYIGIDKEGRTFGVKDPDSVQLKIKDRVRNNIRPSALGLFDIVTALQYSSTLAAIMMAVSLCVTFSMLIRKQPIAPFFLLGHGLFVFFSALAVFFYKGKAEFSYINSHGVGIGILLEALVLSLIVAYRIRILENLKATQADLQVLASTDPLTQLFNRRHFSHAANQLLNQAKLASCKKDETNLCHSSTTIHSPP